MYFRCPSAKIVSKASELLPDPETPVADDAMVEGFDGGHAARRRQEGEGGEVIGIARPLRVEAILPTDVLDLLK
jgi:hypothetical protein